MPKITFRRGRKIGDPNYSSTEFGIEFEMQVEDELFNDDEVFAKFCATNYSFADQLLEAEIGRIYASRPKRPVPTAAAESNGDGQRAIEEARSRREPVTSRNNGVATDQRGVATDQRGVATDQRGVAKEQHDWDRSRNPERDRRRDDRGRGGDKSYGPPRTGKQLFAWAKGHEEKGADGFVMALGKMCKEVTGAWRFDALNAEEVEQVHAAGEAMLEDRGGY